MKKSLCISVGALVFASTVALARPPIPVEAFMSPEAKSQALQLKVEEAQEAQRLSEEKTRLSVERRNQLAGIWTAVKPKGELQTSQWIFDVLGNAQIRTGTIDSIFFEFQNSEELFITTLDDLKLTRYSVNTPKDTVFYLKKNGEKKSYEVVKYANFEQPEEIATLSLESEFSREPYPTPAEKIGAWHFAGKTGVVTLIFTHNNTGQYQLPKTIIDGKYTFVDTTTFQFTAEGHVPYTAQYILEDDLLIMKDSDGSEVLFTKEPWPSLLAVEHEASTPIDSPEKE